MLHLVAQDSVPHLVILVDPLSLCPICTLHNCIDHMDRVWDVLLRSG